MEVKQRTKATQYAREMTVHSGIALNVASCTHVQRRSELNGRDHKYDPSARGSAPHKPVAKVNLEFYGNGQDAKSHWANFLTGGRTITA